MAQNSISSSSKRPRKGIHKIVNYFEYIQYRTETYNRLIDKFKPGHQVSNLIDLIKLRQLHSKFELRETYNSSFYRWHKDSMTDVNRKIAFIRIRDHMRLLMLNKEIANCLVACISLPIEILKIIADYLPYKILSKLIVQKFIENGSSFSNASY